jgi:hypothetical protein
MGLYDDDFDDEDEEQEGLNLPIAEGRLSEAERWKKAVEAQADVLARACEENEELVKRVEALEFQLTEAEIARDEYMEENVRLQSILAVRHESLAYCPPGPILVHQEV